MPKKTRKTMPPKWSKTIRSWLIEENMFLNEVEDENANFHFIANFPTGTKRPVEIVQPKTLADSILIGCQTNISPNHFEGLAKLRSDKRKELLFNLKMRFMHQRASFKAIQENSTNTWKAVEFTTRLILNELDKSKFMEAIEDNFRCTLILAWTLEHHLGSAVSEGTQNYIS